MIVQEQTLDLTTPTGPMRTYSYAPAGVDCPSRKFPGLVLYSEIFQQTQPIRRLAIQFASHGHVVMVPEIYHENEPLGTVLGYDEVGKNKGNDYKYGTKLSTFDNDARVVLAALKQHPACSGSLGVVGFCLGGHLAFRAAFNPEVRATCCFYATDIHSSTLGEGKRDDSLQRVNEIRGELMMIWGRQDPHVPFAGRLKIYQTLSESKVLFNWHELNCVHAFMRDDGDRYNPSAARLCMGLALDLFERAL